MTDCKALKLLDHKLAGVIARIDAGADDDFTRGQRTALADLRRLIEKNIKERPCQVVAPWNE